MEQVKIISILHWLENHICKPEYLLGSFAYGWSRYSTNGLTIERTTHSFPGSNEYKNAFSSVAPPEYYHLIMSGKVRSIIRVYTDNAMIEAAASPAQLDSVRHNMHTDLDENNYEWRYPSVITVGDLQEVTRKVTWLRLHWD